MKLRKTFDKIKEIKMPKLKNYWDSAMYYEDTAHYLWLYINWLEKEFEKKTSVELNLKEVTRVEIIDDTGRAYYNWNKANKVEMSLQDNGRTLKIFVYGIGIKEID